MSGGKQVVIWALVLMVVSVTEARKNVFRDVVERSYDEFHDEIEEQEKQEEMQDPAVDMCSENNLSYFSEKNKVLNWETGLEDETCKSWCNKDRECVSWTNIKYPHGPMCYLMSAYEYSESNKMATAGIKNCGKKPDPAIWDKVSVGGSPHKEPLTIPMTEDEAKGGKKSQWLLIDDGCSSGSKFPGRRYDYKGIMENIVIYDGSGLIVGKQLAVPVDKFVLIEDGEFARVFVKDKIGDKTYYFLTVYFRPPIKWLICAKTNHRPAGVAGRDSPLYIMTGVRSFMNVPVDEMEAKKEGWVEGGCVADRGRYFWYKINRNMRCQDFLPFYVIYNKYRDGGRLNAWGFYLPGFKDGWSSQKGKKMDGPYWMQKHKGGSFKSLFKEEDYPRCTKDLPNYTKQIFMKKVDVWNYGCRMSYEHLNVETYNPVHNLFDVADAYT